MYTHAGSGVDDVFTDLNRPGHGRRATSGARRPTRRARPAERKGPTTRRTAERMRRALRNAQLPAFCVYDLRRTVASLLLDRGAPTTYVAAQLGHADAKPTSDDQPRKKSNDSEEK